ncbi:MAG TPA: mechanosensitive ion channel [Longimicrobiales bacterium]|nr:mechanosensitive ion channel [Longimicrobiales bacterium]
MSEQIAELDFRSALEDSQAKVLNWIEGLITHLPNIVAALLIFAIFLILARVVRGVAWRVLGRISSKADVNHLIGTLAFVIVLFAGVFFALDVLNLDRTVTSLLAGAGIIGLALGFAFQDTAENFISGVFLAVRGQFTDGDIVETNEYRGVVQDVNLRSTIIRTFSGQLVILPNSKVFKNPLVNYTAYTLRRVDIDVGVSYGDDLRKAADVASRSVADIPNRIVERKVEVFYTRFNDHSIDFQLRFWIPFALETDYLKARSEAVMRIKEAFDREGITIPFPIRTVDFSRVGGATLAEAWPIRNSSTTERDT